MGLVIVGGVSYWTIEKVKVGGSLDGEMLLYSDLNADILPPALDIERVRYGALLMLEDGKGKLVEDVALFQGRKKEYVDGNESWKKRLPDGKLKDLISVQAYEAGQDYMKIVEQEMVPAIERGDKNGTQTARASAVSELTNCQAATKAAVEMVRAKQTELDEKGKTSVTISLLALLGIGLLVAVAVGPGAAMVLWLNGDAANQGTTGWEPHSHLISSVAAESPVAAQSGRPGPPAQTPPTGSAPSAAEPTSEQLTQLLRGFLAVVEQEIEELKIGIGQLKTAYLADGQARSNLACGYVVPRA